MTKCSRELAAVKESSPCISQHFSHSKPQHSGTVDMCHFTQGHGFHLWAQQELHGHYSREGVLTRMMGCLDTESCHLESGNAPTLCQPASAEHSLKHKSQQAGGSEGHGRAPCSILDIPKARASPTRRDLGKRGVGSSGVSSTHELHSQTSECGRD